MRKYSQACPIARTLDVIGDRWTMIIIRDMFLGATKFGDFKERSPNIPPKVLSARLKMLMSEDIVSREVYSQHPLRAEYRLTDKGRSLLPVMLSLGSWGLDHLFEDEPDLRDAIAREIYDNAPATREALKLGGYVRA